MKFVKDLDGSGRTPNDSQIAAIKFIEDNWNNSVIGLNMPVGSGKSFIARALQRSIKDAIIITPNNVLLQQYCKDYADLVPCMGKDNYANEIEEILAFGRYKQGNPAIFNLASFWYKIASMYGHKIPKCIILDEADSAINTLQEFGIRTFKVSPKSIGLPILTVLLEKYSQTEILATKQDCSAKTQKRRDFAMILAKKWYQEVLNNSHNYTHKYSGTECTITPVILPQNVSQTFFKDAKIVLLSATLAKQDLATITNRDTGVFESFSSPIPVAHRKIYCGDSLSTSPKYGVDISDTVEKWITTLRPLGNGLVHATYSDSATWSQKIPNILHHTPSNKRCILDKFKKSGGVLLGSGMSAGIDLPGDLCRWNLIPRLQFPNISDLSVAKRKALPGGEQWYEYEALRHVMQASGRSTRNKDDWSSVIILDPRFSKLFNRYFDVLPKWFRESVSFKQGEIYGFINSRKNA